MSEFSTAAASTYGNNGLYTVEEQEQFYSHLFDHANDHKVTAITNMIDQAANDVNMGIDYLAHHTIDHHDDCAVFLTDALHAL